MFLSPQAIVSCILTHSFRLVPRGGQTDKNIKPRKLQKKGLQLVMPRLPHGLWDQFTAVSVIYQTPNCMVPLVGPEMAILGA